MDYTRPGKEPRRRGARPTTRWSPDAPAACRGLDAQLGPHDHRQSWSRTCTCGVPHGAWALPRAPARRRHREQQPRQAVAGTGTDAAPYFSGCSNGHPGAEVRPGRGVRRVPELRHPLGKAAHEPWSTGSRYAEGYQERIVDHAAERDEALPLRGGPLLGGGHPAQTSHRTDDMPSAAGRSGLRTRDVVSSVARGHGSGSWRGTQRASQPPPASESAPSASQGRREVATRVTRSPAAAWRRDRRTAATHRGTGPASAGGDVGAERHDDARADAVAECHHERDHRERQHRVGERQGHHPEAEHHHCGTAIQARPNRSITAPAG